jgi:hypothetical protein
VGADEDQDAALFEQIAAWGLNTTMLLKPGQDLKLVESNGRGHDCFSKTIAEQTEQIIYLISGNTVVADGGSGFQNASLFRAIRNDLIQADANVLAHVENFQIIPLILEALGFTDTAVTREYVTASPAEVASEAQAFSQVAAAITALSEAFVASGSEQRLDVGAICNQFAIPVLGDADGDGIPEADADGTQDAASAAGGGLRLIQGGAAPAGPTDAEADPGSETAAVAATGQPASDTALNGAQVTSLVEIVRAVAAGELPRDAAIGILKRAFLVSDDQAAELLGSAGNGFVPTTAPAAPPAAPPARTGPPAAEAGTEAA